MAFSTEKPVLEFVFWELFDFAAKTTGCRSTSAAAYAAILGMHMLQKCNIDLSKKNLEEIIIITHSKFAKEKVKNVIAELRKTAQNFQNRCTGAKTFLSRLRRQALREIQNLQKLTYVNELYAETDNAKSLFSLASSFEDVDNMDSIDIYDKDTLSCLLATQPLHRRCSKHKTRMRPLLFPSQDNHKDEDENEKGGAE